VTAQVVALAVHGLRELIGFKPAPDTTAVTSVDARSSSDRLERPALGALRKHARDSERWHTTTVDKTRSRSGNNALCGCTYEDALWFDDRLTRRAWFESHQLGDAGGLAELTPLCPDRQGVNMQTRALDRRGRAQDQFADGPSILSELVGNSADRFGSR